MEQTKVKQEVLHKVFSYREDGMLLNSKTGGAAGAFDRRTNMYRVRVGSKTYPMSKLIYCWHTGEYPSTAIKHKDGNTKNCQIENLYVSERQSSFIGRGSSSGYKGIQKIEELDGEYVYKVNFYLLGAVHYGGYHKTMADAVHKLENMQHIIQLKKFRRENTSHHALTDLDDSLAKAKPGDIIEVQTDGFRLFKINIPHTMQDLQKLYGAAGAEGYDGDSNESEYDNW